MIVKKIINLIIKYKNRIIISNNSYSFKFLYFTVYNTESSRVIIRMDSDSKLTMSEKFIIYLKSLGIILTAQDEYDIKKTIQNTITTTLIFNNGKVKFNF